MEQDHKKKIEQTKKLLGFLFVNKTNIALFNQIKDKVSEWKIHEGVMLKDDISLNDVQIVVADTLLNELIFSPCEKIYLFQTEPFKVLEWIRGYLKNYEVTFAKFILDLILQVVNDKTRFQKQSSHLEYIITELEKLKIENISEPAITNPEGSWMTFFTGKDTFEFQPW